MRLGYFAGPPMQAKIQTVDSQLVAGKRCMITGFRPLADAPTSRAARRPRRRPAASQRWRGEVPNNRTGLIPQITSGMFHRFEVTIPSQRWTNTHGVYPEQIQPDGDQ